MNIEQERLKQELVSRYDFNVELMYKEVDDWNYKYIDSQNLKRFLLKTGVAPGDVLLICIIRRFDLDGDAKINLKEFMQGVIPQDEFSKKQTNKKQ